MSDVAPIVMQPADGAEKELELRRVLGPIHLIMLGIGAIVGAGIFVITGHAAAEHAGPAVVISFVIAGTGCLFAGLCYAEFASMIPVAGSAYTYAYATMGGFIAWFIGWNLVLEYLVAASTVAVGWSGYFTDLMHNLGVNFPTFLTNAPFDVSGTHNITLTGALINLPAAGIVLILTAFLVIGAKELATFNGLMVLVKLAVVLMVIGFGLSHIKPANLTPFIPPNTGEYGKFGWTGILAASSSDLLCLYRLRCGVRGGAGSKKPATRHAYRHFGFACHLHHSIYPDGAGADRHRALPDAEFGADRAPGFDCGGFYS